MAGFTYATLTTAIQNYTEVDTNVLTSTITDQFIDNAEMKILRDIPLDAYKKQKIGNLVTGQTTINVPAKTLFVKGVQVYTSTSAATGANTWLEKKDVTYLQEYVSKPLTQSNVPDDILEQFIELNNDLERAGLYIDDVHAGNVRLNINDRIRIVDGEIYTNGEVYVKNILVKGIDERIEGMESVLGCNRIIRWVDNRTSVNEIVYNKFK